MLRQVGFRDIKCLVKLGDRTVALRYHIQNSQADRVGEGLADNHLLVVELFFQLSFAIAILHCVPRQPPTVSRSSALQKQRYTVTETLRSESTAQCRLQSGGGNEIPGWRP